MVLASNAKVLCHLSGNRVCHQSHRNAALVLYRYCAASLACLVTFKDPTTVSFLQVIMFVVGRSSYYMLVQLAGRHWSASGQTLRQTLTRTEWRTILGLDLFGVLSDLVMTSTDRFDFKDALPILLVQIIVLSTSAWRAVQQWRQIIFFERRLALMAEEGEVMRLKRKKYHGHRNFHWNNIIFYSLSIALDISLFFALLVSPASSLAELVLFQQLTTAGSFVFWASNNKLGLLL